MYFWLSAEKQIVKIFPMIPPLIADILMCIFSSPLKYEYDYLLKA